MFSSALHKFSATPQGITIDGLPLTKASLRPLSERSQRYLEKATELMKSMKPEDWDNQIMVDVNHVPKIVKVGVYLTLANPIPMDKYNFNPSQSRDEYGRWTDKDSEPGEPEENGGSQSSDLVSSSQADIVSAATGAKNIQPVPVTRSDGSAVKDPATGKSILMPSDISLENNIRFGEQISDLPSHLGDSPGDSTGLSSRETAMTTIFMRGGAMDYQRTYSNQTDSNGNTLANRDYIDFGNYNYGAVGAAAGYNLSQLLDAAAAINATNFFKPSINVVRNPFSATPDNPWLSNTRNNRFIAMGFQDYQSGKVTSSKK